MQLRVIRLRKLYARVPTFECLPGCTECCGPHHFGTREYRNIKRWLKKHGRKERFAITHLQMCPYIEDGCCSIYEVRPMICRLYGAVEGLECPYVSGPGKLLTREESHNLLELAEG